MALALPTSQERLPVRTPVNQVTSPPTSARQVADALDRASVDPLSFGGRPVAVPQSSPDGSHWMARDHRRRRIGAFTVHASKALPDRLLVWPCGRQPCTSTSNSSLAPAPFLAPAGRAP